MQYEYKVVPAPIKGRSEKGVRGAEAKFANELNILMNELGADGWEYIRSDTLPCEERTGLTTKVMSYQNLLIFRRSSMAAMAATERPRRGLQNAEIVAVPAQHQYTGIVGVQRARKDNLRKVTTTYTDSLDIAAE